MSSTPAATCRFFLQGRCTYGDRCKFLHRVQEAERLRREQAAKAAEEVETRRKEQVARQKAELERQKAARRARLAEQEIAARARLAEQEAAQQARQIQLEAQKAGMRRREAAHTIQHIVLGTTLITYGAGFTIQEVVTGFESCHIRIKNLPADATQEEIKALFTQQGVEKSRFFITGTKKLPDGRLEATLITTSDEGSAIAIGLEDIEFRQERLHFEVMENTVSGGMGSTAPKDCNILTMSWRAPSRSAVATFPSVADAAAKVKFLNRKICGGRQVRVEMNQPPPTQMHQLGWQRAVKISGLPLLISPEEVTQFAGSYTLKFLKPIDYNIDTGVRMLRQQIELLAARDLVTFDVVARDDIEGNMIVKARFTSWEAAKRVEDNLAGKRLYYLGNCTLRLRLPDPHQYILSIPPQQYQAQKHAWDSLTDSDGTNTKTAFVRIFRPQSSGRVQIKVVGEDKSAVGALKVRVENLAGGEALGTDCWHRSFKSGVGTQFMSLVLDRTGAYARADWKLCVVKVYGDPASINRARDAIKAEVDRLNALEWSVFLKTQSVRFFVQRGLAALKEALGDDNATLVISRNANKIVIRGGEEARCILTRLIDESLEETASGANGSRLGASCPICYDEISHPVTLGCNHTYCMTCLRHYISTAADNFPLNCLGNEATCETPIALPTIEKFLPTPQFHQLLERAFLRYIEQRPQEFKYCKTPDCSQVYRRNASGAIICPSCFLKVCSLCDEEVHDGMSCEERQLHSDPDEQERRNEEWAAANGTKRCPACSVWIEKIEGCNHMTCKCGAHICWICLRQFDAGQIYAHLNESHGGLFEVPEDPPPRNPVYPLARALPADPPAHNALHPLQLEDAARLHRARQIEAARALRLEQEARAQQVLAAADLQRVQARLQMIYQGQQREALRRDAAQREAAQREAVQREAARREREAAAARRGRENNGWGCVVM
ncbi:hypothetical protein GGX14DRAFT_430758 [Mycena pura]|uniref:RBR-type E3 ubiquitin transferase n=1 Tax=Mycena pura TaxID=153505 RepID=A0AAD6YKA7_9AGAR|nr:hypothetical protein GGX14DRAFT_430758 [Mycena pura]